MTFWQKLWRIIQGKPTTKEVICKQWLNGEQYFLIHNLIEGHYKWFNDYENEVSRWYGSEEMARVHFGEWLS